MGKVLIDFDFEIGMRRFMASSPLPREQFEAVIWDENWIRRYERGEISTADYHRYLCEAGKLGMGLEEFHESWGAVFLPEPIVPEQFLGRLKKRYPLILVSNTNESHAGFVARTYSLWNCFDRRILSHEVGSLKPDRGIYEAAIAAAGKPPEALFFTDDREENIQTAREMGIRTHQFRSLSGLVEALKNHDVDVGDFVPA